MKKLFIISFTILAAAVIGYGQSSFTTYQNARFGFSIEYPSDLLKKEKAPDNDDGRTFKSRDGVIEMRVWGQHNALDQSLREKYNEAVAGYGESVTYKVVAAGSFTVSGVKDGNIFYQKTLFRKDAGVFYTFTIEYPKSQKSQMDAAVTRIARSFKFDPNADI